VKERESKLKVKLQEHTEKVRLFATNLGKILKVAPCSQLDMSISSQTQTQATSDILQNCIRMAQTAMKQSKENAIGDSKLDISGLVDEASQRMDQSMLNDSTNLRMVFKTAEK
jgi:hypothetical protein